MGLTLKDGYATLLMILSAFYSYALLAGMKMPYLMNFRLGSILLLLIGVSICAIGSKVSPESGNSMMMYLFGSLAVVAVIAAVAGLIFANKLSISILGGTIVLMWLLSTLRHLFLK